MVYTGRILAVSYSPTTSYRYSNSRFHQGKLKSDLKWRAMVSGPEASAFAPSVDSESADKNDTGYFQLEFFFLSISFYIYVLSSIGRKRRIGK